MADQSTTSPDGQAIRSGVVAKFYCGDIEPGDVGTSQASRVHLGAVCRGAENAGWASYTPGGSISLTIRNTAAVEQFEVGAEYLVTFTRVEKPELGDGHAPEPMPSKYREDGSHYDLDDNPEPGILCARCGIYTKQAEDGTIDWSTHDKLYAEGRAAAEEFLATRTA